MKLPLLILLTALLLALLSTPLVNGDVDTTNDVKQQEQDSRLLRWGRWRRGHGNRGGGGGGDGTRPQDLIQKLRQNRHDIDRSVDYDYPDGVQTTTGSSTNPEINEWIYNHIEQMKQLIANGDTIRNWDGLFAEIYDNADKLTLECNYQEGDSNNPVVCTHTGDDCYAQALAKAHAKVVSLFLSNRDEMSKDHEYLADRYARQLDCNDD